MHEQTIICRQLFAGHVVSCRPMKRKKKLQRMMIWFLDVMLLQKDVQSHVDFGMCIESVCAKAMLCRLDYVHRPFDFPKTCTC